MHIINCLRNSQTALSFSPSYVIMGSGTSKKAEVKAQEVMHKVAVVNALDNRHVKPRSDSHRGSNTSQQIKDFVKKQKEDKNQDWSTLQEEYQEGGENGDKRIKRRQTETKEEKEAREKEERLYGGGDKDVSCRGFFKM